MCCRVKFWSKNSLVLNQNLVQVVFLLSSFVVHKSYSFCRENEIFQKHLKKKEDKLYPIWVKAWSNYAAQHTWTKFWRNIGPSFDSTFLSFLALVSFFKKCWNHYFYRAFSKDLHFLGPPQKLETLFVNTTALTDYLFVRFFCIFVFWVFAVSGFWGVFFERNEKTNFKTKQQKRKDDHKMQTTKPLSPTLTEKPDNTDTT